MKLLVLLVLSSFTPVFGVNCTGNNCYCPNGNAVDRSKWCDGVIDCDDNYDEADGICKFHCNDIDNTIIAIMESGYSSQVCDGKEDCPNGADEKNCHFTPTFTCGGGKVITLNQICDGVQNCMDGLDEFTCGQSCGLSGQELCPNDKKMGEAELHSPISERPMYLWKPLALKITTNTQEECSIACLNNEIDLCTTSLYTQQTTIQDPIIDLIVDCSFQFPVNSTGAGYVNSSDTTNVLRINDDFMYAFKYCACTDGFYHQVYNIAGFNISLSAAALVSRSSCWEGIDVTYVMDNSCPAV